jgi:GWxTD domain-containing protein
MHRLKPFFLLSLLLLGACASGGGGTGRTAADLTNPFLGPERSSWLIGPIARIATPEEIQEYLALTEEAQAEAFIEKFWAKRDAAPDKPGNALRKAFDDRAAAADRMFSEAGYSGRRTDRGTIFILYGPPTKTDFDVTTLQVPLELWAYAATAPSGLDGKRPNSTYRFLKKGDLTVLYHPGQDPRLHNRPTHDPDPM